MLSFVAQFIFFAIVAGSAAGQNDVIGQLHVRDQALLDALAPGNVKVWDDALAPNAIYVDENGEIIKRAEFLKQLQPLPQGVSGTISIVEYIGNVSGDVATIVHKDNEDEHYHGQDLHAQYLTTETWQKQGEAWKLLQVHTYSVLHEPPTVTLQPSELDEYTGRYKAGPGLLYIIKHDGDQLTGGREGRPGTPLLAEVRDVFFVSGQLRTRKIFTRDKNGRVTGFVDRREGNDLVWKKVR